MLDDSELWRQWTFREQPFHRVVKVGGSVVWGDQRKSVARAIAQSAVPSILFPGGGEPDNAIERVDAESGLARVTINRATLLAQDQTALLLADADERIEAVRTLIQARESLERGLIPILMPSQLLEALDPFHYTGKVSSDTMALWLAEKIGAEEAVILKSRAPVCLEAVGTPALLQNDKGYVDRTFPHLLEQTGLTAIFVDTSDPQKTEDFFVRAQGGAFYTREVGQ